MKVLREDTPFGGPLAIVYESDLNGGGPAVVMGVDNGKGAYYDPPNSGWLFALWRHRGGKDYELVDGRCYDSKRKMGDLTPAELCEMHKMLKEKLDETDNT